MGHSKLEDFKVGDEVQHKSNDDILMVVHFISDTEVYCRWVTADHKVIEKVFYPQELVKFEKPYD